MLNKDLGNRVGITLIILAVLLAGTVSTALAQGPGGIDSDISLWYDANDVDGDDNPANNPANGTAVSAWEDKSANSLEAAQGTSANQPTYMTNMMNGQPVVSFDGSDYLQTASIEGLTPAFPTDDTTVFVVSSADSTGQQSNLYNAIPFQTHRFSAHLPWGSNYYFDKGQCCGSSARISSGFPGANTFYIWGYRVDAAGAGWKSVYFNGNNINNNSGNSTFNLTGYTFGIGGNPSGQQYQGDIAELLIYNRALDDVERVMVENYLEAKYEDATTTFNITNDYYAGNDASNGDYDWGVEGIGNDGTASILTAEVEGLTVADASGFPENSEYLLFGHDGAAHGWNNTDDLGAQPLVYRRWNKDWYIDSTGTGYVDLTFDFGVDAAYGAVGSAGRYVLLARDPGGAFALVADSFTVSTAGAEVTFENINVADIDDKLVTLGEVAIDLWIKRTNPEPEGGWHGDNVYNLTAVNQQTNGLAEGAGDAAVYRMTLEREREATISDVRLDWTLDTAKWAVDFTFADNGAAVANGSSVPLNELIKEFEIEITPQVPPAEQGNEFTLYVTATYLAQDGGVHARDVVRADTIFAQGEYTPDLRLVGEDALTDNKYDNPNYPTLNDDQTKTLGVDPHPPTTDVASYALHIDNEQAEEGYDNFWLRGDAGAPPAWTVTYWEGTKDVTAQLVNGTYRTGYIARGDFFDGVRVDVSHDHRYVTAGTTYDVVITATSGVQAWKLDRVTAATEANLYAQADIWVVDLGGDEAWYGAPGGARQELYAAFPRKTQEKWYYVYIENDGNATDDLTYSFTAVPPLPAGWAIEFVDDPDGYGTVNLAPQARQMFRVKVTIDPQLAEWGDQGTFTVEAWGSSRDEMAITTQYLAPIPTLGEWGLIAFVTLLGGYAVRKMRQRRAA